MVLMCPAEGTYLLLFPDVFSISSQVRRKDRNMFSQRIVALVLAGLFAVVVFNACAQWSPAKTVVNLGDLSLAGAGTSGAPRPTGSSPGRDQLMNESSTNNSAMNNSSLNNSSLNNSSSNNSSSNDSLLNSSPIESSKSVQPIDLSGYSQDRRNKNLAGYKNIMYPIAESRGSTASTTGGGCGCG